MATFLLCRRTSSILKQVFTANAECCSRAATALIPINDTGRRFCSSSNDDNDKKPEKEKRSKIDLAKPKNRIKVKEDLRISSPEILIDVSPELLRSVKSVSEKLGGNREQTESDLLQQLRAHSKKTEQRKQRYSEPEEKKAVDMSSLFAGMKVEKEVKKSGKDSFLSQKSFNIMEQQSKGQKKTLFEGARLNIFEESVAHAKPTEGSTNPIFDKAEERQVEILLDVPPCNAFEEMIQWTRQGILWKFPIDNDQGRDEEKKCSFKDHIFLEKHLQDFPKKGPLRHFMELVCVGLSKNYWITVDEKIDHINWFKDYFKDKMNLLQFDEAKTSQISQ
ncbi:small ribosomal subunit protein mS31-like [Tubulanus polymorphus]|uniref:small ribosomal subunit protein mS31-like n=1 Tax=Tubulanus polymorphus TaxID=672921 RepID=UPI003DA2497A